METTVLKRGVVMGLFSKKKEIPVPSDPFTNNSAQSSLNDIPYPPLEFSQNQSPIGQTPIDGMPSFDAPQMPLPSMQPPYLSMPSFPSQSIIPPAPSMQSNDSHTSDEKELPAFDKTPALPPMIQQPAEPPKEPMPQVPKNSAPIDYTLPPVPEPKQPAGLSFELPDFDDEEINALEKVQEKIRAQKTVPDDAPINIFGTAKEPEKIDSPQQDISLIEKEKYVDILLYFEIKEYLDDNKALLKSLDDGIENHVAMQKTERYHLLTLDLNAVQDKLMQIDTKLFNG